MYVRVNVLNSVPKLQFCLGVKVENLGLKKTVRVKNYERNVG